MSVSINDPLMENATRADPSLGFRSVITPMVPLHIPSSIRELLRNITRLPGCRRTDEWRFVLDLNIRSEEVESYCAEFTKSTAFEIKNLLLGTGRMLHIVVFIC